MENRKLLLLQNFLNRRSSGNNAEVFVAALARIFKMSTKKWRARVTATVSKGLEVGARSKKNMLNEEYFPIQNCPISYGML